jgi:hypothetical protein
VIALTVVCVAPVLCAQDRAPVEPRYYEFYGAFEDTPVRLGGEGLPELFSACTELLSTSGVEPVAQLTVEGRRFTRTTGYFDRQEACGFVVLNARPPGPSHLPEAPLMTGSVDGIPFRLWDPPEEAAEAVRTFLPMAVRSFALETVIVDGTYYPPRAGAWSVEEVVALIERALSPSAPPEVVEHGPGGLWSTVADRPPGRRLEAEASRARA